MFLPRNMFDSDQEYQDHIRMCFAAKAIAEARFIPDDAQHNLAAAMHCYEIADALLAARSK